jgi:nucleoid DNA-binding protein
MTKAELIERVYGGKHLPRELTKKTVAQIVDAVFTEMGDYFIRTRVSRNQGARLTYP